MGDNEIFDDLHLYLPNTTIETQNSTDYTFDDDFNEFIDQNDIDINKDLFDSSQQGQQNHNNDIMEQNQNPQTLTTNESSYQIHTHIDGNNDHGSVDEKQIDAFEYCQQLLEKLRLTTERLQSALVNLTIPARTADAYLKGFEISQATSLLNLGEVFQAGIDIFPSFRLRCNSTSDNHTDPVGQQSHENSERTTSGPSEPLIQQDIQVPTTRTQSKCEGLSTSLAQLFAQAQTIIEDLQQTKLQIINQPKPYWRKRTLRCLMKGWCTAIQGQEEQQQNYIRIKWSTIGNHFRNKLFVLAQLLSYDNIPHKSKVIVPAKTKVKPPKSKSKVNIRPKLKHLIIDNTCGFNFENRSILIPITQTEHKKRDKNLKIHMFSLYQAGKHNEENSIDDELEKLCKIRIRLCYRTEQGELKYLSNFVDTEIIEESKSTKDLAIESITPNNQLCKCGNETITVQLNTNSEKQGFVVCLNDKALEMHKIRGVNRNTLSFQSIPPTIPDQNVLPVKITKKNILRTIKLGHNPYDGILEDTLCEGHFTYVDKSENPHKHIECSNDAQ